MHRFRLTTLAGSFALALIAMSLSSQAALAQQPIRGDVNSDRRLDIADPIFLLNFIFAGGKKPTCLPAANTNGDAHLDISDAITLLTFLFSAPTTLPPLTEAEIAQCDQEPPPVTVVRHGRLIDVLDPGHGVDGKVEQLSNGILRIKEFFYDGTGTPQVVVLLTKSSGFDNVGFVISPDLLRDHPYFDETLEYPIPAEATNDTFKFVSIWCDDFPLTYAYAQLFDGP
jgi:hypothetical protein